MMRVEVGAVSDIEAAGRKLISIDGVEIGIFHVDGRLIGWRNEGPHQQGPVCQGRLFKRVVDHLDDMGRSVGNSFHPTDLNIVCPWHGMEFDVRTGKFIGNKDMFLQPATVEVVDGNVYVTP